MPAEGGSETGGDMPFSAESAPSEASVESGEQVAESAPQDSASSTDAEAPAEETV